MSKTHVKQGYNVSKTHVKQGYNVSKTHVKQGKNVSKTTPFTEVHGSLLCPGLHPTTNFTNSRRFVTKNRGRNNFFRT